MRCRGCLGIEGFGGVGGGVGAFLGGFSIFSWGFSYGFFLVA